MTQTARPISADTDNSSGPLAVGPDFGRPWLAEFRQAAAKTFARVGYPSATDEDWRYTPLAPLTQNHFRTIPAAGAVSRDAIAHLSLASRGFYELVFVDGYFSAALSQTTGLSGLIEFHNFQGAAGGESDRIAKYLGHELPSGINGFAALNAASFSDGVFLYIPAGVTVDKPIHILWATTRHNHPVMVYPRGLIYACSQSRAVIVQTYADLDSDHPVFTNVATEVIAGRGSHLELIKIQRQALLGLHMANEAVHVHGSATFQSLAMNLGAVLTRNNLSVHLAEPFAQATLNGLTISAGSQRVDNHTLLDHARENCPSHELYKSLLAGNAAGVFRGKILVRPDAQKTDSKQTSKAMLLSDSAVMNSQPQLEIYANDVKCTHGSTTGPLDDEQLFYLQSRGVSAQQAQALLTYAFAGDVLDRIIDPAAREFISVLVAEALSRLHIAPVEL